MAEAAAAQPAQSAGRPRLGAGVTVRPGSPNSESFVAKANTVLAVTPVEDRKGPFLDQAAGKLFDLAKAGDLKLPQDAQLSGNEAADKAAIKELLVSTPSIEVAQESR